MISHAYFSVTYSSPPGTAWRRRSSSGDFAGSWGVKRKSEKGRENPRSQMVFGKKGPTGKPCKGDGSKTMGAHRIPLRKARREVKFSSLRLAILECPRSKNPRFAC